MNKFAFEYPWFLLCTTLKVGLFLITSPPKPVTTIETLIVASSAEYYNAPSHYIDGTGSMADYDPLIGPGAQLTEVTNYENIFNKNEELRLIRAIKPNLIAGLVSSYKKSVRG